jgi:copper(I)-binding protein
MGLTKPLVEGQSFPLTLNFERAGSIEVTVMIFVPEE